MKSNASSSSSSTSRVASQRAKMRTRERARRRAARRRDASATATAIGQNPRVVVLGGGFGGLYTALKLAKRARESERAIDVVLCDRASAFAFKPLLYELVNETMGRAEVAPSYDDLVRGTGVEFVRGDVVRFDVEDGRVGYDGEDVSAFGGVVTLRDGTTLAYDYLVLALGASTSDGGVDGAKANAIALNTAEDAEAIARALNAFERDGKKARVAVVGGGLAGVELAAVVAERLRASPAGGSVDMITPNSRVMTTSPPGQRAAAMKVLNNAAVNVVDGRVVRLDRIEAKGVDAATATATKIILNDANGEEGEQMYDLVCWTVGQRAVTPSDWPLPMTATRKVKTDATLRVYGHSRIYAVGDASSSAADLIDTNFEVLPSTAQVAFQQADYAAWNIWAAINGRPALPFRYQHIGDMMVLGARDAAVALPVGDVTIDGPAAAALRRLAYLYRMPTDEHRMKVAQRWIEDGVQDFARDPAAFLARLPNPFASL